MRIINVIANIIRHTITANPVTAQEKEAIDMEHMLDAFVDTIDASVNAEGADDDDSRRNEGSGPYAHFETIACTDAEIVEELDKKGNVHRKLHYTMGAVANSMELEVERESNVAYPEIGKFGTILYGGDKLADFNRKAANAMRKWNAAAASLETEADAILAALPTKEQWCGRPTSASFGSSEPAAVQLLMLCDDSGRCIKEEVENQHELPLVYENAKDTSRTHAWDQECYNWLEQSHKEVRNRSLYINTHVNVEMMYKAKVEAEWASRLSQADERC